MNILFLTMSDLRNLSVQGIYPDLMKKCRDEGHCVYIISAAERKHHIPTQLNEIDGVKILKVWLPNMQKTNVIEKGICTLLISTLYKRAINQYLNGVKFDLILYSTPPITFTSVVKWIKRMYPQAVSYLLLKDIFPQNAVDLGMFGEGSLLHRYFRRKERQLYNVSDHIGCMSPANVEFVKKNNPKYPANRIEVAPNSYEVRHFHPLEGDVVREIKLRYQLPLERLIFVYGGNLGKPQGISYLIQCLEANKNRQDCHFLIVGNGTEYKKIEAWHQQNQGKNVTLLQRLPKAEYDKLVQACDVGLIFLDHRFTIPNYPSRLLTYLEYRMPVICATDQNTDIGRIAEENGYGFWCESLREVDFSMLVNRFVEHPEIIPVMGEKGYRYLCENYTVQNTYDAIMGHFSGSRRVDE